MLKINEIFYSIQGESSKAGFPCVFVRFSYCNLRCSYCDTEYAFTEGTEKSLESIIDEIAAYGCRLVEITGGEPLLQQESPELMKQLCDLGYEVLLETGGSLSLKDVDKRVKIIMDIKCPSSGMHRKNLYANLDYLKAGDEIKFVIGSPEDFMWAMGVIREYNIDQKCILISPVFGKIEASELAGLVLENLPDARFQLQMHKYIWDPSKRGV